MEYPVVCSMHLVDSVLGMIDTHSSSSRSVQSVRRGGSIDSPGASSSRIHRHQPHDRRRILLHFFQTNGSTIDQICCEQSKEEIQAIDQCIRVEMRRSGQLRIDLSRWNIFHILILHVGTPGRILIERQWWQIVGHRLRGIGRLRRLRIGTERECWPMIEHMRLEIIWEWGWRPDFRLGCEKGWMWAIALQIIEVNQSATKGNPIHPATNVIGREDDVVVRVTDQS